jgi:hypothetical protein
MPSLGETSSEFVTGLTAWNASHCHRQGVTGEEYTTPDAVQTRRRVSWGLKHGKYVVCIKLPKRGSHSATAHLDMLIGWRDHTDETKFLLCSDSMRHVFHGKLEMGKHFLS